MGDAVLDNSVTRGCGPVVLDFQAGNVCNLPESLMNQVDTYGGSIQVDVVTSYKCIGLTQIGSIFVLQKDTCRELRIWKIVIFKSRLLGFQVSNRNKQMCFRSCCCFNCYYLGRRLQL